MDLGLDLFFGVAKNLVLGFVWVLRVDFAMDFGFGFELDFVR